MPVIYTNTQDEWKRRRIDVRHINPSIMEGERGHTSMLGQGSAVPIVRYAPTFLFPPYLTGDFKIPSVLTANPGVIDASPKANIFYQWYADGVMLIGETGKTLTTSLSFDDVEITCEVTAVNFLGVDVGFTNGITPGLVEPIINEEYFTYAVSGLSQDLKQNMFDHKTLIATGISMYLRTDVQQQIILIPTGMWVELRDDVMSGTGAVITGLGGDEGGQLYHNEAYVMWQPTRLADLAVVNPSAESGDMTGWTVIGDINSIVATSVAQTGTSIPTGGNPWYFSSHLALETIPSMSQVIDIDVGLHADIDAGLILGKLDYALDTYTHIFDHHLIGVFEYLDASNVVLNSYSQSYQNLQNSSWTRDYSPLIYMPALTRKVRLSFTFSTSTSYNNNVYLDDIVVSLYKDGN